LFHGFLVIHYRTGLTTRFQPRQGQGFLYVAPLILDEDIFDAEHADRNGLVFAGCVSDDMDASPLEASFRAPSPHRSAGSHLGEPFPEAPIADLVLHIHRELIHHLSEVCVPSDLYLHTKPATNGATR
jgi:hypothetical protein